MKKFSYRIAMILFFIIFLSFDVAAYDEKVHISECYMQDVYEKGNIALDDIYNIGKKYQKDNISEGYAPEDTYCPYLDKNCVNFLGNVKERMDAAYYVKDTSSRCTWICTEVFPGDSYVSGYPCLMSPFMDGGVWVDGNMEELEEFIEKSKRIYEQIYRNAAYIKRHLDNSQYGGYYYQKEDEKVHIYLLDDSKRKELEKEGIVCEEAKYSLYQMNEKIEELWSRRQELGITYLETDAYENQLIVTVKDRDSKGAYLDDPMLYIAFSGTVHSLDLTIGEESTDVLLEYLQGAGCYKDRDKYSLLTDALDKLKKAYPHYDYTNLFYHIAKDFDYERYLDFPEEINEYVDQLPAYQKTSSFMNELQYGDPSRLELKRMLREYKKAYPKMSYKDIYETYIKEIEEDDRLSSAEKLYWYLYDKYTAVFENTVGLEGKDTLPTAVFGSAVLVIGGAVICGKKKIYQ